MKGGAQAFWICPLVSESELIDLKAAETRAARAEGNLIGPSVGLIHGKMAPAAKDAVMAEFADGTLSVLVATTVVEVGVNVPNATIMVIEQAERFGLAQLHQLRGRVGRGRQESSCVLLYDPPLSETAQKRLDILRRTDDGFLIAETDLELRGGGDALGLKQSGFSRLCLRRCCGPAPRPDRRGGRRREIDREPRPGPQVRTRQGAAGPSGAVRLEGRAWLERRGLGVRLRLRDARQRPGHSKVADAGRCPHSSRQRLLATGSFPGLHPGAASASRSA